MFRSYIPLAERRAADRSWLRLSFEGLLLGGSGLGIFALIFEIASDAFSVAAYQTLLAIEGASGHHDIAILAFGTLSIMLFFGVVPAYKAGAYLSPNTGGSGPLVDAIGPPRLSWLSWIGSSMFFIDAVLTIIISSIAATDATLLLLPEIAPWRLLLAETYAACIMLLLVALGPKRAVPLFLLGGGAFTLFTLFALNYVGLLALTQPELGAAVPGIIERLQNSHIVEHVTRVSANAPILGSTLFFQFFLRSMSSAMLGFSGYEVIPASGKHAARPKWKVVNTALILAALFLILTGIIQLFAARTWEIPATEGYSTLLIEYELAFGEGSFLLTFAGLLLAVILLFAQGGGYVGGAAVAAYAARLGRLPRYFANDRIGIAVIWLSAAIFIPAIPSVTRVEAYYAFGFVSAFVITSTTVFFVRPWALIRKDILPGSPEARAIRFAGLRGMIASYLMLLILITQKTSALPPILIIAALITLVQLFVFRGGLSRFFPVTSEERTRSMRPGMPRLFRSGRERSLDEVRQIGIVCAVHQLLLDGKLVKYNVAPTRIRRLICHVYDVLPDKWKETHEALLHSEQVEPGNIPLQEAFQKATEMKEELLETIEQFSHFGIFTYVNNYSFNWVSEERDVDTVQRAMIHMLFRRSDFDEIWAEFNNYQIQRQPEEIWQFARQRYQWAKEQWPNIANRLTTIWALNDLGIIDRDEELIDRVLHSAPLVERIDEQIVRRSLPLEAITSLGVDESDDDHSSH
ncbi:MAG: hypothetical protein OXF22_02155 [Anaerolineaceae bacterium]|nr:hypothetical protein [Anaerolineaceae bacterium]